MTVPHAPHSLEDGKKRMDLMNTNIVSQGESIVQLKEAVNHVGVIGLLRRLGNRLLNGGG